jgi:eukaryotic-like serine/threonine-protein kinase
LHEILKNATNGLPERQIWHLFGQLMQGVRDIHGSQQKFLEEGYVGLVHRDLKPRNLIIGKDDNLKIIDFGVSGPIIDESNGETIMTEGRYGTRKYMAPEVLIWEKSLPYYGDKADMFSCGVILYNMACGKEPFR